jgi:hypothetical protein
VIHVPFRLKSDFLYSAAEALGDMNDSDIRKRTGIAKATFSRLVNQPTTSLTPFHILAKTYDVRVDELYEEAPEAQAGAVA